MLNNEEILLACLRAAQGALKSKTMQFAEREAYALAAIDLAEIVIEFTKEEE